MKKIILGLFLFGSVCFGETWTTNPEKITKYKFADNAFQVYLENNAPSGSNSCSDRSFYSVSDVDGQLSRYISIIMTAYTTGTKIKLAVSGCETITARPKIVGVLVE